MKHELYREQQLRCDIKTAWKFFSSPENLSLITPKELNFIVLSKFADGVDIFEGMCINYKVSPLLGIPMNWETEITHVNPLKSFTDFQKKGPYKVWEHFHEFIENEDGVLMKDHLEYELPLGFAGEIVHSLIVHKKVNRIFDYRYQILNQLFNA